MDFKTLRLSLGMSQDVAARHLNVTPRTVHNWDKAGAPPVAMAALEDYAAKIAALPPVQQPAVSTPRPGRPRTSVPKEAPMADRYYWATALQGHQPGKRVVDTYLTATTSVGALVWMHRPTENVWQIARAVRYSGRDYGEFARILPGEPDYTCQLPDWLHAVYGPADFEEHQQRALADEAYTLGWMKRNADAVIEREAQALAEYRHLVHAEALVLLAPPGQCPEYDPIGKPPRPIDPDLWARAEASYKAKLEQRAKGDEERRIRQQQEFAPTFTSGLASMKAAKW